MSRRRSTYLRKNPTRTILGFGLSIPVFFATDGWLLWIVGPALAGLFRQCQRRNHRRPQGS